MYYRDYIEQIEQLKNLFVRLLEVVTTDSIEEEKIQILHEEKELTFRYLIDGQDEPFEMRCEQHKDPKKGYYALILDNLNRRVDND